MGLLDNINSIVNNKGGMSSSVSDPKIQSKVIIDSIEDGVILMDDQQTIQLINPAACLICGWKIDEASGISADIVVKITDEKGNILDGITNPLHSIFRNGQSVSSSDYFLLTRSNKNIPIRLHVSPLFDEDKQVVQAVAVINNISEEKSNERQRADFISTASHEMRTPVAAIEGYLALALNDRVATIDSRARDYLEKAHVSTQHLGSLFQDLLTSAKAEDGRLTSNPVIIDFGEYIQQICGDFRLVAEQKGLILDYASGDNKMINATRHTGGDRVISPLFYVYADPERIREVITNLFDNAAKYTSDGKITIGVTGNDQVVQFYIKDTGIGIPAEDLPHLFQKFYRVDNSSTRTIGGTGLGLFICRKIIELYDGRIWVESEYGKGSTFYINLPRVSTKRANELKNDGIKNEVKPINS